MDSQGVRVATEAKKSDLNLLIIVVSLVCILVGICLFTRSLRVSSAVEYVSSDAHFHQLVAQRSPLVVMFAADWCGHCKHTLPHYIEAAQSTRGSTNACVVVAKHDKVSGALLKSYGVEGFPTIIAIGSNGHIVPYQGNRSTASIVEFIRHYTQYM